ncbi:MAG: hypothetical protein AAGJ86_01915 [Pseudomonadota bacterium]
MSKPQLGKAQSGRHRSAFDDPTNLGYRPLKISPDAFEALIAAYEAKVISDQR